MASDFQSHGVTREAEMAESRPSSSGRSSSTDTTRSAISLQTYPDKSNDPLLDYAAPYSAEELNSLPQKRRFWLFRLLRHFRYTVLTVYRRIFLVVLIPNVVALYIFLGRRRRNHWWSTPLLLDISTAISINIMVAILIRQDYIINTLFKICWCIPLCAPLRLRRSLAKIYEYGGLHSGTAVCSVLWYSLFTGLLVKEFLALRIRSPYIKGSTYPILFLFWTLAITAYPRFRYYWHNVFEHLHRWGGWIIMILFWVQLVFLSDQAKHQTGPASPGAHLFRRLAFWCHVVSTCHVILPWLRLRKLHIRAERLSTLNIRLHFTEKVSNCVVYRISCSPLGEWHSFACIPERDGAGGSFIVASAGDWTRQTISSPKNYYYTRGIPTVGVLCVAQMFRKVAIVTTGSGIGPCLGTVMGIPKTSCRILWSAPGPLKTFGDGIYNAVLEVDPKAVIIDTKLEGRPDLVQLIYEIYRASEAEAIFCVSNRKLTRKVVYEMESRGIPAFGPIWDS